MTRKVVVNDTMQKGYVYYRTEAVGRNFAPGFTPQLTPKEMLRVGLQSQRLPTGSIVEVKERDGFGREAGRGASSPSTRERRTDDKPNA
jgi:hypothetical protein